MDIGNGTAKNDVRSFLDKLAGAISGKAPPGTAMEREIRRTVDDAKQDDSKKHLRLPEAAFLNLFAVPALFEELQATGGLTKTQAREALLNEYYRCMPDFSTASPFVGIKHPFNKMMGVGPDSVYASWQQEDDGSGLASCAPDFALRAPFPHRILFEGKYFSRGTRQYAARELVKDIYQAFFYRGLAPVPAKNGHAEWNYDYACLLAFDASPQGTLLAAWNDLGEPVRQSFWESANVYVMILGGQGVVSDAQA
jgi:hypothetical protein